MDAHEEEMKTYTEHDLEVAKELGGLKTLMQATHDKIGGYIDAHDKEHRAMWTRVDDMREDVEHNTLMIYRGMGIAAFMGAVFGAIGHWLKVKLLG